MCLQEYIQYQCGHRSTSVVRPCPATTAGIQFPVCTHQATWASIAKTMCPLCERIIHSRWVVIREWEHRWLHERGACGCDIVFPGTQFRPRVSGAPWGLSDAQDEGGPGARPQRYIAPISESLTWNGRDLNTVRILGLYAAEWIYDHRVLHRTGQCRCRVDFRVFRASVSENDFNPEEASIIAQYRNIGIGEAIYQPAKNGSDEVVDTSATSGVESVGAVGFRRRSACHSQASAPSPSSIDSQAHESTVQRSTATHSASIGIANTVSLLTLLDYSRPPWRNMQREYLGNEISGSAERTPYGIAGLPIGAGPEGQVHMPSFYAECRLSRPMPKRRHSTT